MKELLPVGGERRTTWMSYPDRYASSSSCLTHGNMASSCDSKS
jgi:hypothetical protein